MASEISKTQLKFAQFVKAERMKRGWTQSSLGEKVYGEKSEQNKNLVYRTESLLRPASPRTMDKYLEVFNAEIEFITHNNG